MLVYFILIFNFHVATSTNGNWNLIKCFQVSIYEIYNETIRDLLSSNRSSGNDHTRTENSAPTPSKQHTIKHESDLATLEVCSAEEISSLLQQAAQSRYMVLGIWILLILSRLKLMLWMNFQDEYVQECMFSSTWILDDLLLLFN